MELNQGEDGTYLGEWTLGEEATEGPVELVLPESEHATDIQWDNRTGEERLEESLGSREDEKGEKDGYGGFCFKQRESEKGGIT